MKRALSPYSVLDFLPLDSSVKWVVGIDEVGAGCLAGPVVAAAFAHSLDEPWFYEKPPVSIQDSKLLNEERRIEAQSWLSQCSMAFSAVAEVSNEEIDSINILNARMKAMALAYEKVRLQIALYAADHEIAIFVDGNRLPSQLTRFNSQLYSVVKGDSQLFCIAASSIFAKNYRDQFMAKLSEDYPAYEWNKNVGYPTTSHKAAIAAHGLCVWHRKSFSCV